MNSDQLNRWLALLANVGVLVGIFLLIVEIDQNNELMQAQIEQSRSETLVAWRREIVGNENAARVMVLRENLLRSPQAALDQLGPSERMQLVNLILADFYDYENLFSQYERGLVGEEYWNERVVPAIQRRASSWQFLLPPDGPSGRRAFKDEVERILRESAGTSE
jgi:hypothetical protein